MQWRRCLAGAGVCILLGSSGADALPSTHYTSDCAEDEVQGEVQGETGNVCSPPCAAGTFMCPKDVPEGTTAQPQCIFQDRDQAAWCGLMCQVDQQCPSGASCQTSPSGLGVCIHSLSFYDWVRGGALRRKLVVGLPQKAGSSAQGFQVAKAYSALQSLKRRYGIADSDPDTLTVKELLSAVSVSAANARAAGPAAGAPGGSGSDSGSIMGAWQADLNNIENRLGQGLPGLASEVNSIVWNVEHIDHSNAAVGLLRGLLELAAVYLVIGCIYKHFAFGSQGLEMIPHLSFWMEYPALVADGVKYSMILVQGTTGGFDVGSSSSISGRGSGGFQPIGARDRDTFSNFEDSKP